MTVTTIHRPRTDGGPSEPDAAADLAAADLAAANLAGARRAAGYRRTVSALRRRYDRQARRQGALANILSLLLVAAGAAVGLTPYFGEQYGRISTALGVAVILLEGISRVLRPAVRAGRARRTARALEREFRLFDAGGRAYRAGGEKADAMFVVAVERILDHASAEEDRDDAGGSDAVTGKDRRRSGDGTTASST